MSPATIFNIHLIQGYLAWLLCFGTVWPKLRAMERVEALRLIAMLHGFRFFGLVFILPGVTGRALPSGFAPFAAYGDLATGLLAMAALATVRIRPLFWLSVLAFNLVGAADLLVNYYHGVRFDLPAVAGELGAAYAIVMVYVPILMITHVAAFALLLRPAHRATRHNEPVD